MTLTPIQAARQRYNKRHRDKLKDKGRKARSLVLTDEEFRRVKLFVELLRSEPIINLFAED